jgi:hypothetical protein
MLDQFESQVIGGIFPLKNYGRNDVSNQLIGSLPALKIAFDATKRIGAAFDRCQALWRQELGGWRDVFHDRWRRFPVATGHNESGSHFSRC